MKFGNKKNIMTERLFGGFVLFLRFFCHSRAGGNPDSNDERLDPRIRESLPSRFDTGDDRGRVAMRAIAIFIGLGFAVFGGAVDLAYAVDNSSYVPLAPLPGTTKSDCVSKEGEKPPKECTDLNTYIPGIFNLAIGIAGVLAVLMIVIGGVEYMTTDAIQGKSDGKERINNALMGLLLVLVSWILLYTINPRLTIFDLSVTDQEIVAKKDVVAIEYIGTGVALTYSEIHDEFKNPEGYVVRRDVTITNHEDGGHSYEIMEYYTDKKGNNYTTRKTKSKDGVFSTERRVQYIGKSEDEVLSIDDKPFDIPS